jgi:hypothetical protein
MINEATKINFEEGQNDGSDRLMKPLAGYIGYNSEWHVLVILIFIFKNNINSLSMIRFFSLIEPK